MSVDGDPNQKWVDDNLIPDEESTLSEDGEFVEEVGQRFRDLDEDGNPADDYQRAIRDTERARNE